MSGANEAPGPKSNPFNGFEETVKDFWVSRPRRPHTGRKVAGVAAGLGNRYGIDPVVIRVALVAAMVFGGFGLVFYLLGWLFFPSEGDEVSGFEAMIGRGQSTMSKAFAVVLCIALIPVIGWTFGNGWFDGGGLIGFALLTASLYLLHRNRGQDNRPAPVVAYRAYQTAQAAPGTGAFTMTDTSTSAPTGSAAPGFDPLAADPAGWDLPDPAGPPPQDPYRYDYDEPATAPRHPRSKIGSVTFAAAVLVAGLGVVLNLNGVDWFSVKHIIGLVLGVLGIGMVAGAFVRGSRGLIGLAVPLAIVGMVLTTTTFTDIDLRGGVGDLRSTPHSVAEVQPVYHHAAGDLDLDLTQIPLSGPITTSVSNGAGDTKVTVPATADVTYTCKNSAGDVDCLDRSTNGVGQPAITGTDYGTDGVGGQKITLDVTNGAGSVEVLRG
ncbi:PspC domain-containing protein [Amycolatopsis sp. FDAARGOS 1241]|uniref:PspC domain-containing protein n=1 Tax=Amycolatopsis sp. FDAARGOS 1241 TaxID=2778070 RepID=UPI00194EFC2C|nr:PspC domain-containing protein [Amycolatopsis sp. FDAARGOS 1241]QRP45304.1 PspC domain-containing protein [Amycolatopsis sp. FDAARGOS 1241]